MKTEVDKNAEPFFSAKEITGNAELLNGLLELMLTLKQEKAIEGMIDKLIPKAREVYVENGVPMTLESLENVLRGSVVKKHPEALKHALEYLRQQQL